MAITSVETASMKHLNSQVIKQIKDLGRIEVRLTILLDETTFSLPNRKDAYWDHPDISISDKLDDLRSRICFIEEKLWDIMAIIKEDEYE